MIITESGRFGKIRAVCLCVLSVGLVVIIIKSLQERHNEQPSCPVVDCSKQMDQSERSEERNLSDSAQPKFSSESDHSPQWDYNWDLKAPAESSSTVNAERILILIRHGKYDGATGKLTELGRLQANLTGQRLKSMNLTYKSIIHSTMDRAIETAQIIHKHLSHVPIYSDEMIIEGGPVPPNPTVSYWKLPDRSYFVDGPRMEAAFRRYFHRPEPTDIGRSYQILVGHGNIFRFFTLRALQLPKDAWMRLFIAHASITQIFIRSDGTVATSLLGDSGHLPHDKVTY